MAVKLKPEAGPRLKIAISAEAVEAYKKRDYTRLHLALGLPPWEESPLYADRSAPVPDDLPLDPNSWAYTVRQAQQLARALDVEVLKQAKERRERLAEKAAEPPAPPEPSKTA